MIKSNKNEFILILILIIVSGFFSLYYLGQASLFETDEYIYTQISKEILQTGDWMTLHLLGKPWFIHPPGYMWITAVLGFLFGFSEFTARLGCALFGIFGVVTTYFIAKEMFDARVGFISGLVLASSFQYVMQARLAVFDPPLIVFMLLAALFFFIGFKYEKRHFYLISSIMMGLGTIVKGPIALILPLLVIFIYLLIVKKLWETIKKSIWHILGAIVIYAAIALPWFVIEYLIHGMPFIERVFGYYTFGRYFDIVETHTGPIWLYIPIIIIGFLPWIFIFPFAVKELLKEKNKEIIFSLVWIGTSFIFFSLAKTKLPGYILSIYPFMSIVVGKYLSDKMNNSRLIGISVLVCTALSIIIFFSVVFAVMPQIEEHKPMKPLATQINQLAGKKDKVIGYNIMYPLGFDYYTEPTTIWLSDQQTFINKIKIESPKFILVNKTDHIKLQKMFSNKYTALKEQSGVVLLIKI